MAGVVDKMTAETAMPHGPNGSVAGPAPTAEDIIGLLGLAPHPEKGFFVETFRDAATDSQGRAHSTQIYYLLKGESGLSHWHRVTDAVELWHYYAGAPLRLLLSHNDGTPLRQVILGTNLSGVPPWFLGFGLI